MTKIKDIAKCKHPNSRKTGALLKQIQKSKAREKSKAVGNIKLNLLGEKVAWFRDNLEENCECYTPKQTKELIEKYLARFNDELEQIKIKHSIGNRKNRQHANREDMIKLTMQREAEEFNTCGTELPDILNVAQFKLLKNWQGELRLLQNFKFKRYRKNFLEEQDVKTKQSETMDVQ